MSLLPAGIVFEVDWDNDGDFDEPEEDMTSFLFSLETKTGRDWPSQLTGKAGPGLLKASLDNTDNRFAHFNTSSPLNTDPFSLKTGRKCRVRTTVADTDPALLAKDRFGRAPGTLLATENGLTWTNHRIAQWVVSDQRAQVQVTLDETGTLLGSTAIATVDVGADDHYTQITCSNKDGTNEIGIVYRFVDEDNYGFVGWRNQSDSTKVIHWEQVAGVFTDTFDSGVIEFQGDTTFGVLVDGTTATIYVNGVPMASGDAYTGTDTLVGIFGDWDEGRDVVVDDFYVWAGLDHDLAGVLWTGDVSDIDVSVGAGQVKVATIKGEGWLAKAAATDISPPESVGVTPIDADSTFGVVSVGQRTGELVGKALAKAALLHPPGPIQRGDVLAGSVGLATGKALAVARQFEEAEFGFLYETPEGPIGFDARTARDSSYSLATFSDDPTAGQLGYETIKPYDWRREIVNEVGAGLSPVPPGTRFVADGSLNNASGVDSNVFLSLPDATQAAVGDLLLFIITPTVGLEDGRQEWITPRDWVAFNASNRFGRVRIFAKKVTQSDLGGTVTFYDDISPFGGSFLFSSYVVSLWYGDIAQGVAVAAPDVQAGSASVAGQGEVPVLFPAWGKETTLFIATRSGMDADAGFTVTGTGPPNGYQNFNSETVNGATTNGDAAFERAFYAGNSDVESPGSFTGEFRGFRFTEHNLIAVRGFNGTPPPPGGVQDVVVEDLASQDAHNAVRSHRNPANLFRSKADARTYADLVLARYADDRPIFALGFTATSSADHLAQATARRVGDRITVIADNDTGLAVDSDFHIESIANRWTAAGKLWKVTWELSPAEAVNRADTVASELGINIDDAVTELRIDTTAGQPWISSFVEPNMFPFAVQVEDEIIRLLGNTSDPDNTSPQFYNVERGIDGTTPAAHLSGVAVALAYPWELP